MNYAIRSIIAIGTAALVFGLSACHDRDDRDERSERSERSERIERGERSERDSIQVESQDLGSYSAIDLRGAAEIKITVGSPESLKIEGSDSVVRRLRTEVRNNTLYIVSRKSGLDWFGDRDRLKLAISLPKLESLISSGAGNIEVSGLNGGEQTIRVSGAHNIEATGQLDKVTIELEGAGNVDYGSVIAQNADVTVSGAGHVLVNVSQALSATMNGVGAIQYEGNPQKVESKLHGIGSISKK